MIRIVQLISMSEDYNGKTILAKQLDLNKQDSEGKMRQYERCINGIRVRYVNQSNLLCQGRSIELSYTQLMSR